MKKYFLIALSLFFSIKFIAQPQAINANIKDTTFQIAGLQINFSITSATGGGGYRQIINFKNKKANLKADKIIIKGASYKKDTIYNKKINNCFKTDKLKRILNQIYTNSMIIEVPLADSIKTINLINKEIKLQKSQDVNLCGGVSCPDCDYYTLDYKIFTTEDTINLVYTAKSVELIICSANIKNLRDWLFMYQLINLTMPDNALLKDSFNKRKLNELIGWTTLND